MKKELLEKIKRVMEKVSEKLMGTWAFSYCKDTVNVCIWDGAYSTTVEVNKKLFEKCNDEMCILVVLEALTDDEYITIRDISDTEYNIVDMLKDNCIDDEEVYWIDYMDGMLNIKDSEDNEWYEIDLTDCELVKVVEPTVEQEMELHIKYDDLMFIIKEVEGEAVCKVSEIEKYDLEGYCGACDLKEMSNYIDYLSIQLEELKKLNKKLTEERDFYRGQFKNSVCKNIMDF